MLAALTRTADDARRARTHELRLHTSPPLPGWSLATPRRREALSQAAAAGGEAGFQRLVGPRAPRAGRGLDGVPAVLLVSPRLYLVSSHLVSSHLTHHLTLPHLI
jgi:hypothetical protein